MKKHKRSFSKSTFNYKHTENLIPTSRGARKLFSFNFEVGKKTFSFGKGFISRTTIIQHLITKYKYQSYLEIGIRSGNNYKKIKIKNKIGVDPNPIGNMKNIIKQTSDEFFDKNKKMFDIIFIDGLHLEDQVTRDINNSLKFLSKNGIIVLHDCSPPTKFHQRDNYCVDGKYPAWNGTAWRAYVKKRMLNQHLFMCVINCDWGVGIIKRGKQILYPKTELTFENLEKDRKKMLNLMSVDKFLDTC